MRRNADFARGSHVPSAVLDAMQDEAFGLIPATDVASGATALALRGADGRWWTSPDTTGVADGTLRVLDTSVDWRERRVWGTLRVLGAANRRPGQASDHLLNDPTSGIATRAFDGWTGTGGKGAAGATVADGTPPTITDDQFSVILDEGATTADRVWLYARPSDGALCLYNDSGAALHAELLVWGARASASLGATPSIPGRLTSAVGLATSDGSTWTTAITITPTGPSMLRLRVDASALRADGARGGAWSLECAFRTPTGGPPVQVGDTLWSLEVADDLSGSDTVWKVRLTISGNNVLVQVRGATSTSVKWKVEAAVVEVRA